MNKEIGVAPKTEDVVSSLEHDEALWQEILAYDLGVVTKTFAERNSDFGNQATTLEVECKRFLYLAAIAPEMIIAPTKPIDEYWHQFVLFSIEYEAFCKKFCSSFVHHNPLGRSDQETVFKRTQRMVVHLFGEFREKALWFLPMPATSCSDFCSSPVKVAVVA